MMASYIAYLLSGFILFYVTVNTVVVMWKGPTKYENIWYVFLELIVLWIVAYCAAWIGYHTS